MQPPKTIDIIINPKAGKGFPDNAIIARLAASRFKEAAIFTGQARQARPLLTMIPVWLFVIAVASRAAGYHPLAPLVVLIT
jgi:hypothetical protein